MQYNCPVCPNNCVIAEGKTGICGVRSSRNGKAFLPYYGVLSAVSTDPVEKKPLYHYHPGKTIFSVGFYGCSLSCPFCQNYRISKEFGKPLSKPVSPARLAESAAGSGSFGIAYTYSEPIVHLEYILETAAEASSLGLKNVLVTNGYINAEPAERLLEITDAVNIDLKSFNPDFYRNELKAKLEPVLKFITKAAKYCHIEVTTLVIPGKNDSEAEISESAAFLASIDKNIPFHLSAYYPSYKYSVPPTRPDALIKLAEKASEKLNFVYTGNIAGGRTDTICPGCGNTLIKRSGYSTVSSGLIHGKCSSCGQTPALHS
ncbi:MAG: AmmeMemoRadiSam system radical SAM enzyme [Spirochaetales bacterium]|nr:AmmeMemoRadiSam system radical SAM enzyme [Spirochaetales bacterium]